MPAQILGLWSPIRQSWWVDKAGLVFHTTSASVAAAQLQATLTEERHLHRNADWTVATISGKVPVEEGGTPQE